MDTSSPAQPLLVYGYGNPGRQDDGLGVRLVEELEAWAHEQGMRGVVFDSNYQLNAEDALAVASSREVIFVDAAVEGAEPFEFRRLVAGRQISFSTHAMPPESILALAEELYNATPPAWILAIRGYAWEVQEPISPQARSNLDAAFHFLCDWLLGSGNTAEDKR